MIFSLASSARSSKIVTRTASSVRTGGQWAVLSDVLQRAAQWALLTWQVEQVIPLYRENVLVIQFDSGMTRLKETK